MHGEVAEVEQHLVSGQLLFRHVFSIENNDGHTEEQVEVVRLWTEEEGQGVSTGRKTQEYQQMISSLIPQRNKASVFCPAFDARNDHGQRMDVNKIQSYSEIQVKKKKKEKNPSQIKFYLYMTDSQQMLSHDTSHVE